MKRTRRKCIEQQILEIYDYRTVLTMKDKQKLFVLVKGYLGELRFDEYLKLLKKRDGIRIVKDLRIAYGDTYFQIDLLIAIGNVLLHYEVKNYSDEYTKNREHLVSVKGLRILDPKIQIQRANTLLFNTMKEFGYDFAIHSYCVFVDPSFHIFQHVKKKSVLFFEKLEGHFEAVNRMDCYRSADMDSFLQKLVAIDQPDYRPRKLPYYAKIRAGIACPDSECTGFENGGTSTFWQCVKCHFTEPMLTAIARTAREFHLLYPENEITTRQVYEWCDGQCDMRQIRRALKKYFLQQGSHGLGTTFAIKSSVDLYS